MTAQIQLRFQQLVDDARRSLDDAAAGMDTTAAPDRVLEASIATARMLGFFDGLVIFDSAAAKSNLAEVESILDEVERLAAPRGATRSRLHLS